MLIIERQIGERIQLGSAMLSVVHVEDDCVTLEIRLVDSCDVRRLNVRICAASELSEPHFTLLARSGQQRSSN